MGVIECFSQGLRYSTSQFGAAYINEVPPVPSPAFFGPGPRIPPVRATAALSGNPYLTIHQVEKCHGGRNRSIFNALPQRNGSVR